jgi:hypothetical protein
MVGNRYAVAGPRLKSRFIGKLPSRRGEAGANYRFLRQLFRFPFIHERDYFRLGDNPPRTPKIGASRGWKRALACMRQLRSIWTAQSPPVLMQIASRRDGLRRAEYQSRSQARTSKKIDNPARRCCCHNYPHAGAGSVRAILMGAFRSEGSADLPDNLARRPHSGFLLCGISQRRRCIALRESADEGLAHWRPRRYAGHSGGAGQGGSSAPPMRNPPSEVTRLDR